MSDVSAPSLADVGRALYGDNWQSPLARDLGVTDRTMRRWAADAPPDRVWPELLDLLDLRMGSNARLIGRIRLYLSE